MADEVVQIPSQNGDIEPPKTAKQLEKEAKKQAKLDKLKQKLEKKSAVQPAVEVSNHGTNTTAGTSVT